NDRLVAQRLRVKRRPRFLITSIEEPVDYRCPVTTTLRSQFCDDIVDRSMDASDRAIDSGQMRTRQPIRQADKRNKIDTSDAALLAADPYHDLQCPLGTELPPKNSATDDLGGELCHFAQGIHLGGRKLRQASPRLHARFDHHRPEFRKARGMDDRGENAPP